MATSNPHVSVERYLTYLDKEMTIMGILSGFCIAALAASIKALTDKDAAIAGSLWHGSPLCVVLGNVLLLLAGLWFYQQRSSLAWYYGQIALEDSGYSTGTSLYQWLQYADGWDTWVTYQRGFLFLIGAFCELGLAGLAGYVYAKHGRQEQVVPASLQWEIGTGLAAILAIGALMQKLILEKWPLEEDPYGHFRRAPLDLFRRERDE